MCPVALIICLASLFGGCPRPLTLHAAGVFAAHSENELVGLSDKSTGLSRRCSFTYVSIMMEVVPDVGPDDIPRVSIYPGQGPRNAVYLPIQMQGTLVTQRGAGAAAGPRGVLVFSGPVATEVSKRDRLQVLFERNERAKAGAMYYEITAVAR